MARATYMAEVPFNIAGIPCLLGVTEAVYVPADPYCDSSDWDFYGYSDISYDVLDRKGYRAEWLEKKATRADSAKAEEAIFNYFEKQRTEDVCNSF